MTTEAERLNIVIAARDRELARAIDSATRRLSRFAGDARKDLGAVSRSWDRTGTAARTAAAAQTGFFNVSRGGRFVLQNTAAQVGDMAVQFESGTAASRILAQQLPQVFGGFAALGGALGLVMPLLGTVAAVGIPAAAIFLRNGEAADEAADDVETFEEALSSAQAALGRMEAALAVATTGSIVELEKVYGDFNDRVKDLVDSIAEIETRAARIELGQVLDQALGEDYSAELDRLFGDVGTALVSASTDAARGQAQAIRDLIAETQNDIAAIESTGGFAGTLRADLVSLEEELAAVEGRFSDIGDLAADMVVPADVLASIGEMRTRLEEARAAGDFAGMADALSDIRNALEAAGAAVNQGVLDGLVRSEDMARQFAARMGEAEAAADGVADASGQIADGLAPSVAEAERLAAWFGISLERAARLAALGPQGMPDPNAPPGAGSGRGGDPRDMGGSFADWQNAPAINFDRTWSPSSSGRSGGAGGAAKVPDELKEYEKLLERLKTAYEAADMGAQGYVETLEALRAQYASGQISGDQFEASLKGIRDRFEESRRQAEQFRGEAASAFADIVTGAASAKEALSSLLQTWASRFANSAFNSLFSSGAAGGIFSGIGELLSFDGGGYTGSGPRSGGMDGKGGFPAMLHPNESVIDHTKNRGQSAGGGGGPMQINVTVSGARGNAEIEQMVQSGVRQGLGQYDRLALPRSVRQINRDPRRIG